MYGFWDLLKIEAKMCKIYAKDSWFLNTGVANPIGMG